MAEPITTGIVLAGVGGWFANKLLGPSADELGQQLKIYASSRLSKILRLAEEKAGGETLNPLPPGFALQYFQKASLSEDDDQLTEAWANLLTSASRAFENRYLLFVDILNLMTASDARFFNDVFEVSTAEDAVEDIQRLSGIIEERYSHVGGPLETASEMIDEIRSIPLGFRGALRIITIPYSDTAPGQRHADHVRVWRNERETEIDALIRNGLLREFSINPDSPYHRAGLDGVIVTALGTEFHKACAGRK